jgi:hypothetical protein
MGLSIFGKWLWKNLGMARHCQKLGPMTKGKDKLKESRSKPSPYCYTGVHKTSEKKNKIINIAPK